MVKKTRKYKKKLPTIKGEETYTDTIIAEFTDAEFKTKDGTSSNITERKCSYAKSRIVMAEMQNL